MLRIILQLLLVGVAVNLTNAGDFALIADLDNGTIYAGSMEQRLSDLMPLPLRGVVRPVAVDYDPVQKMVYWADMRSLPTAKISRAHLDGSNQMTVVDGIRHPEGLALDVESSIMFWTDGTLGHIGRAQMNGTGNNVIIVDNLDQPRTIVTDHARGHIYWTDWGASPRIERADFDGNTRRTIAEDDLHWPNGVAIDLEESKLYWCDASLDKIERSDLSGSNREVVLTLSSFGLLHPFDLTVYEDDVYWTDWATETVVRVHVTGRGEENFGPEAFQKAGGIHIQKEPNFCDSLPCINGATCVDVINGFVCQCPQGFQGTTCSRSNVPCDSGPCVNGGACTSVPGAGFTCQCPAGYQGPTCALAPNLCVSGPCLNGGICTSSPDGFTCQCLNGYEGLTCAVDAHCMLPPETSVMVVSDQQALYLPGDSVEYDCPDGYHLNGSSTRICRSDFTWSGKPAECIPEVQKLHDKGKMTSSVSVAVIACGTAGAVLVTVVLIVVVVAIINRKRRTRIHRDGLVAIPDIANCARKKVFGCNGDVHVYTKYESHIEPIYHESIF